MLKKLLIVINKTNQKYSFTNTECSKDSTLIQAYSSSTLPSVNLTSGQHDEGCDIPDCSGPEYYAEHHMTISGDNNTFTFWFDDYKLQYYYSQTGSYGDAQVIPGDATPSGLTKKVIFIMEDNTLLISDIV
ncbi:hypothetical protein MH117_05310 [Paenibacillus sp. ACRRX]|uniref:hypothetical protein n=1 Tax=Paenibacillus sp. ACRRX TaxID=2918206 RepID=UPI001EF4CC6E|nr:hypothetical protein [Paenibacillus sp. ACRRX]MCG7406829.1 hypothetical protein [Paenibacillus sp. ACRRX]